MDEQDHRAALEAYERGDYDTAIRELRPLAEQGSSDAQYRLAMALWRRGGNFFDEDVNGWFQKAADQGHADAQYEIGSMIMEDETATARAMLTSAAEQGHAAACMELCQLEIEFGEIGLEELHGVNWYRRGRELGHPHELCHLSIYSPDEKIIPTHLKKLKFEALKGAVGAQRRLGYRYAPIIAFSGIDSAIVGKRFRRPDHDEIWPARTNIYRTYAWLVLSLGSPPVSKRRTLSGAWSSCERHVRLLEQVLNEDELRLAHRLTDYYENLIADRIRARRNPAHCIRRLSAKRRNR